ncbi:hypothetical protein ACSBR1_016791 [Camellia fascicularis]
MVNSIVLTPKNDSVNEIHNILIQKFPGKITKFTSIDKKIDPNDQGQYKDFINFLELNGLPSHELYLKKNYPIMAFAMEHISYVEISKIMSFAQKLS